jgi:DNA-binding NarL/FixJ family response regulator
MGIVPPVPEEIPAARNVSVLPRIIVADDHLDMLAEIQSLLEPEFAVVSRARDGSSVVKAAAELRPDALVVDFQMLGTNGIDASVEIMRQGVCDAVVMLSMYNDPQLIRKAMSVGIRGYVLKEDAGEELISALRAVLRGGRYLSRGAGAAIRD